VSEVDLDHQIETRRSCSDNDPRSPAFISLMDPFFKSPKPCAAVEEVLAVENSTAGADVLRALVTANAVALSAEHELVNQTVLGEPSTWPHRQLLVPQEVEEKNGPST
jgi:hypothetical protein